MAPKNPQSISHTGGRTTMQIMTFSTPTLPKPPRRHRLHRKPPILTLQPRRSKMILTRRVHTWTLHPSPTRKRRTAPAPPPVSSPGATQTGFIFRRPPQRSPKRRISDPPYRYLQLATGPIPVSSAKQAPRREKLFLRPHMLFGGRGRGLGRLVSPPRAPLPLFADLSKSSDRIPRLIVIGDVHGCITELQSLLRLANYTNGDQILLLGDLVAKGPDSAAVIKLAKELGAVTVRGNHDYEVIRHIEATKPRNEVSLEHAKIANSLTDAEHDWLVDSPWFVESPQMGYLFVHAGFIPGVKLTQQNPRLMMNMRSVLEDGTVTARHVVGCEWGRLWKGPQTVVFGHDAYRGLQKFDFAVGIDTGCVYGGRLTALLLPENRLISVPAKRAYISPKRFRTSRTG